MGDASCDSRKRFTEFILQHSAGISHYSCLHKDLLDRSYMRENAFTYTVIAAWQMYRLCSQPLRKLLCCKKPISFLFVFESEDILTPWEYMADNISTKVFWWMCSAWGFLPGRWYIRWKMSMFILKVENEAWTGISQSNDAQVFMLFFFGSGKSFPCPNLDSPYFLLH